MVKTLGIERGCAAKNFGTGLAEAKICVIIEGFADRGAKRQNEKQLRKINKIFEAGTKSVLQCKASLIAARQATKVARSLKIYSR